MITLFMVAALVILSCAAAACLIASTQNSTDAARAMGLEFGSDDDA